MKNSVTYNSLPLVHTISFPDGQTLPCNLSRCSSFIWADLRCIAVPYCNMLLFAGEQERGEEEKSIIYGRQPWAWSLHCDGMHTASFVGKIRIRLVSDPLEQSLRSLRGGLVPGQRGGKSIWLANESPQEFSPRSIILSTSSSGNRCLSSHIFMGLWGINQALRTGGKGNGLSGWLLINQAHNMYT